jgi:hypothetical protein
MDIKQLIIGICVISGFLAIAISGNAFGIQYSNHTSEKYQVQFQYPTNWYLTEKASRFDEGTDISVRTFTNPAGLIMFQYINATDEGDFTELFYRAYKQAISSDYSKEYKVIEQPSFLTIDGHKAGTYLYTTKDKYEDDAVTMARQDWIVTAGDHFYLILFGALPNVFDTPELTEVRDHLIKSIHFTNSNNATTKNIPNRFS